MAKLVEGLPTTLEHADTKWVARNEIMKLNFAPADVPAVEKIATEK